MRLTRSWWFLVVSMTAALLAAAPTAHAGEQVFETSHAPYMAIAGHPEARTDAYKVVVQPPGYPPVALYVEETGRGAPLLFLHGLGASGYALRRLMPDLIRNFRVITIDLRGFGRSDKPFDQYYSALDQAAHVREFIRRRGLTGITLAGHSFGGGVAIALTLDLNRTEPGRISRLVLMDAPAFPQPLSTAVGFLRTPVLPTLALNMIPSYITARMSLSSDMGNFGHITDTDIASYALPLSEPGAAHALVTTAHRIVPPNLPDLIRRYPTIRQPTLLIWCRKDPIVPLVTGIALRRILPRARLRIIDGCTHVPTEEAPGELLMHMQMFFAGRT